MKEIKKDKLEDAFDKKEEAPAQNKTMEIGFHQGALNTLINERNELIKMIQQTESIMQAHMKRLEELGVKIRTERKD